MGNKIKVPTSNERRLNATEKDLANILLDNMSDKMKIAQMESELGNAVLEIMTMKMGAV